MMKPLSKARIKYIQSLQHKKFRLKYDKFIVEGLKINKELLEQRQIRVDEMYVSNPDYLPILQSLRQDLAIQEILPQEMHGISQMTTPPGVLSVCQMPKPHFLPDMLTRMKIFYLDAIRDPGNLGTILRTADWFGLDFVICSPDCVDIYNHKVLQASMGSAFRLKTIEMTKNELLQLQGVEIFVCDASGESIHTIQPPAEGIMVLGNESLGVADDLMHQVKRVISIPGADGRGAESLNVASVAAVISFWWRGH